MLDMNEVRLEHMRPDQIKAAREVFDAVLIPIGPLEWHGPQSPLGVDPLNAQAVAMGVARRLGCVVYPTIFCGTERERDAAALERIGFQDTEQYIVGMDFPANAMKSFYQREDAFALTVREVLRICVLQGFRLIALVNGHGAVNHLAVLDRLAAEFSAETDARVIHRYVFACSAVTEDAGHGTLAETSIAMYVSPGSVALERLPDRTSRPALGYCDFACVDAEAFAGEREEHTIKHDPRDASAELGRAYVDSVIEDFSKELASLGTS